MFTVVKQNICVKTSYAVPTMSSIIKESADTVLFTDNNR